MELYFSLLIIIIYNVNIFSRSQNTSDICKSRLLNGHYVTWPNKNAETDYIHKKDYIPKNIIFTRFQICRNQVFLISPRYKEGVPFTLSHVTLSGKDQCYNYVRPFPNLKKNHVNEQGSIINAIDIYLGTNGILWVLDTGVTNTLGEKPQTKCGAKVWGIDYGSGSIIHTILLKSVVNRVRSRLQCLIVEYVNDTQIVYVGDGGTRSIIVWNVQDNDGYRVKLPYHSSATSTAGSVLEDVFYLILIANSNCNYIYYTYLSGSDMFKVRTKDMRKRISSKSMVTVGRKPCKMVIVGSAYESVIYFRLKGQNNLYSWDTKVSLLEENIMLAKKSIDCRTTTHVDVDDNGVLWELESNIGDFIINAAGCYGPSTMLKPIIEEPVPALRLN